MMPSSQKNNTNIRTCRGYKIAPDLRHLVKHEKQAEKPRDEDVGGHIRQSGIRFRNDR